MTTWVGSALGNTTLVTWVWLDRAVANPAPRAADHLRDRPLPRPKQSPSAVATDHSRRAVRRHRLAGRLCRLRRLHQPVLVIQQDLGQPRRRHHHAHMAMAIRPRPPHRRRNQLPNRTQPHPPPTPRVATEQPPPGARPNDRFVKKARQPEVNGHTSPAYADTRVREGVARQEQSDDRSCVSVSVPCWASAAARPESPAMSGADRSWASACCSMECASSHS